MSDTGVFGRLASTLRMDDRRNLLEKLNAQSGGLQVLYDEEDGAEAEPGDNISTNDTMPGSSGQTVGNWTARQAGTSIRLWRIEVPATRSGLPFAVETGICAPYSSPNKQV